MYIHVWVMAYAALTYITLDVIAAVTTKKQAGALLTVKTNRAEFQCGKKPTKFLSFVT